MMTNALKKGRIGSTFSIAALATVQAGGAAPTPIYQLYQAKWDLSPIMLTLIFGVYAFSLMLSLLTVGSLSDFVGRRIVILGALLLSAVSMAVFLWAETSSALIVARAVQGFATGAAASALGAMMLDMDGARGAMMNGVTNFGGTTLGALGASALVALCPAPMHLVYAVLLSGFLVEAMVLLWVPETVSKRPGAIASLIPHVAVPRQIRHVFLIVSPVNIAGWALGGFYLSLMPSLVRSATGYASPLVGGCVVALLTLSGAAVALLWHGKPARVILPAGAGALASGVALTLLGIGLQQVTLLVLGTVVAGAGFGASFFGSAKTILPLALSHQRAGVLSAFYAESYLALCLPSILLGIFVSQLGLKLAATVFGVVVIVLASVSLAATVLFIKAGAFPGEGAA